MTYDEMLDALEWLDSAAVPEAGTPEAVAVRALLRAAESRENTVLGMLLARRPHSEIRDYILSEQVQP